MNSKEYAVEAVDLFFEKALLFADSFDCFSYYTNNNCPAKHGGFAPILAIGTKASLPLNQADPFKALALFLNQYRGQYAFGHLGYELKNHVERLESNNPSSYTIPPLFFYLPLHIIQPIEAGVQIQSDSPDLVFNAINKQPLNKEDTSQKKEVSITQSTTREEYIRDVNALKTHIENGDVYEVNYCIQFLVDHIKIAPLALFSILQKISPTPFGFIQKTNTFYAIGASPERFLKRKNNQLIAQPIKGTIRRGQTPEEDGLLKEALKTSQKEQAENLMIVDLMRNDLAKSSIVGTTKVEELFGIYSFKQLHQMISTVVSRVEKETNNVDILRNAFPMGSMTGAPKVKAMQLIEQYEKVQRGLFSGSVGYFDPEGGFDFNVVIRSIFYNPSKYKAAFQVGSAITYDANAEQEYEECLLKAEGIFRALQLTD